MSTLKSKLLKTEPDKELLAISGSTMQYQIDIDNFVKHALEIEGRRSTRKARHKVIRKSAKNKK